MSQGPRDPRMRGNGTQIAPDWSSVVREQAKQIAELEQALERSNADKSILEKMFHFPSQFKAGVVEYDSRRPFTMALRQELLGPNGETYAYGAGAAGQSRCAFTIDVNNPTFLNKITFGLIRVAHDNAPNPPIGVYLPPSGLSPEGNIASIPFLFRLQSSSGDRLWQTNWRDSVDVAYNDGYELVCEHPMYRDDVIELEVQPWAQRDDANGEEYRLFATLHTYKMFEAYPHS